MTLFELLATIIERAFAWLPRPMYTPRTHALVRWTGTNAETVNQGFWKTWSVPLFQAVELVDLRDQVWEFEPKVLWTQDGKEVAVGMVVVWRVSDPGLLCSTLSDPDHLVARLGESVLPEVVGRQTLESLKRKAAGGDTKPGEWGFDAHLRVALTAVFKKYGVAIESARLNFTSERVRTLKLIGSHKEGE